jgi:dolichol-phosphate mannosyltransferase
MAVIIPMFNEELNAQKCVQILTRVIRDTVPTGRLFIVNDGSKDNTGEILHRLLGQGFDFTLVEHFPNRGYGAALLEGARQARDEGFDFALFMDSDLTNDPALIPQFFELIKTDRYDMVKASRYISGGGMEGVPAYRQLVTIWGNRLASHLFGLGIRDCTNGTRAIRLSFLTDLEFQEQGFAIILEELYHLKRRGVKATEIPQILKCRATDEGQSKFQYSPRVLYSYFKYAIMAWVIRDRNSARNLRNLVPTFSQKE